MLQLFSWRNTPKVWCIFSFRTFFQPVSQIFFYLINLNRTPTQSKQFYSAVMSSNFKTHSNYQPLNISASTAGTRTHFSWLPHMFKYLGLWVGSEPLGKAFLHGVAISGTRGGVSPGVFCVHLDSFLHTSGYCGICGRQQNPQLRLVSVLLCNSGHSELPVKSTPLLLYPERGEERLWCLTALCPA